MSAAIPLQNSWFAPAQTSETAALLATLHAWSERGWLRRLDSAFASFMVELSPEASPTVVMAAALLAHMEGRGHVCLRLDDLLRDPQALLAWGPEPAAQLDAALADLPGDAASWIQALNDSPVVCTELVSDDAQGGDQPLVLLGSTLYLRRYWDYERRVAAQVELRSRDPVPLDIAAVRSWLDLLFPTPVAAPPSTGSDAMDWQKTACAIALRARVSIITGGPGTGKTYTAARLVALLYAVDPAPERLRVALAAPTGKAAARLKQSIEGSLGELQTRLGDRLAIGELTSHIGAARTLHSLLGARPDTRALQFDSTHPLDVDVLIVDEASMIHLEMMASLLEALPRTARVIFLGDKDQLASVEAGAVLGDLCRHAEQGRYTAETVDYVKAATGQRMPPAFAGSGSSLEQQTVMLRDSKRFDGVIGQLASASNRGDAATATDLLRRSESAAVAWLDAASPAVAVQLALHGRPGAPGGFSDYLSVLNAPPAIGDRPAHQAWVLQVLKAFEKFRLLCAVREGDWGASGLNRAVKQALHAEGRLVAQGEWYEGRPVLVTRNDARLGVFNGDIGIALRSPTNRTALRAYFLDGDTGRSVAVSRLAHVETAFAMTVHKSQGSEFAHTVLVLPKEPSRVLTRELAYTGITRAREAFTLVTGRSAALADALAHRTQRASGLVDRLPATEPLQPN